MSRQWTPSEYPGREYREVELRPYMGEILPLLDEDLAFFAGRYELEPHRIRGYIKRSDTGRYLMPIYDPYGAPRGLVSRVPWDGAPLIPISRSPKADTFRTALGPVQSHYGAAGIRSHALVLVEDQLSAIKLAAYGYDSIALLGTPADKIGTYGGQDRVAEIVKRARAHDEVIVALDTDATELAFMFVRKWGSAFKSIRIAILDRDLKDTRSFDFSEILGV